MGQRPPDPELFKSMLFRCILLASKELLGSRNNQAHDAGLVGAGAGPLHPSVRETLCPRRGL